MNLISFRDVAKAFGSKVVYQNLTLDVQKGEAHTIIGGSGQGKSVMLKMLIGLLHVDRGSITFAGEEITTKTEAELRDVRRRIGMLFQGSALFDSLSVRENIAYGLREHYQMSEEEIDTRVKESLAHVDLKGVEDLWPASLSGGMKKRVALARAIAVRPEVLLYDEPTTGLDPITTTRINRLIVHLQRTLKITSIVVTHDMTSAFAVSDRISMIHDGRVIFTGTVEETRSSPLPRVRSFIRGTLPEEEELALHAPPGGHALDHEPTERERGR